MRRLFRSFERRGLDYLGCRFSFSASVQTSLEAAESFLPWSAFREGKLQSRQALEGAGAAVAAVGPASEAARASEFWAVADGTDAAASGLLPDPPPPGLRQQRPSAPQPQARALASFAL